MKDREIRALIKQRLYNNYGYDLPIIDELKIAKGMAFPDMVALHQFPHCYEIKSRFDSLTRLDRQIRHYTVFFKKITIVCAEKHTEKVLVGTPPWVGVWEIGQGEKISIQRKSTNNPEYQPLSLLELLWKDELLELESSLFDTKSSGARRMPEIIENIRTYRNRKSTLQQAKNMLIQRMKAHGRIAIG
jgi:hypothetical protein